jgi:hypothetical protein
MLKKYLILIGVIISISLLLVAALYYPGGSQHDKNSIGYDWKNNYLSNLFGANAVNGAPNASRPWAIAGMLFLCAGFALFFFEFSKKIPSKVSAKIIRYFGVGAMLFAFLAVTPFHDIAITIASTLALISMFYIIIFVFTSKLHLFKILSVVCLVALYSCNYVYFTRTDLEILPVLQKAALLLTITWMLCLQYFTTITDFKPRKPVSMKVDKR